MDPCGGCLTEDLLIEALKRLPVKSLLRFMCVSKPWSRLISDPYFITSHLHFNKSSSSSALGIATGRDCFRYEKPEELFEFLRIDNTEHLKIRFPWRPKPNPKKYNPHISILGHWNGLVLAFDSQIYAVKEHNPLSRRAIRKLFFLDRYIICNPIARRFKILPELPNHAFVDVENPFYAHKKSAFGLGLIDNLVYKIVRVIYRIENGLVHYVKAYEPARAEVYDSRSGSWREVPVNDDLSYEYLERGVYNSFDGCLYWFGRGYGKRKRYSTLVSFHLVDEIWYETLFPYKSRRGSTRDYGDEDCVFGVYGACERVGILGESVVMLVGDQRDELMWNVWKMNKEDDRKVSWTHMYGFDFKGSPKGFCGDGKLLLRAERGGSIVLYDPKKMDDACFGFKDLDFKVDGLVTDFVESLVLLDGESQVVEDASEKNLEKSFWEEDDVLGELSSVFGDDL